MKQEIKCSESGNCLSFKNDSVYFTGTPKGLILLRLKNKGQINAVKEYLQHKNFEGFWIDKNILNLGSLEIVKNTEFEICILIKKDIGSRFKKDFIIEMSNFHRLVLFTILTAEDDFSLDLLVGKINLANKSFEEFTLDELENLQKIDKYQLC